MSQGPERGISVSSGELASEGVDAVLDAVAGTGANAVGVFTGMVVPAAAGEGSREPPLDVDGERRLLDRPLWGRRALSVHRYPVHPGDPELWRDLPWDPPAGAPAEIRADYPRQAIDAARARGLRVYANLTPYALPGASAGQDSDLGSGTLRAELRPLRLTGGPPPRAIAHTGCPNRPLVRQLGRVRVRELLRRYGDVDGLSVDWVEYPVYFLDELFTCFCDDCRRQADTLGYDWQEMTAGARHVWDSLHTLTADKLDAIIASGGWSGIVADPGAPPLGVRQWLAFKAASVAEALRDLRAAMDEHGGEPMRLSANGFALPWGRMSGAADLPGDLGVASQRVKLYSFHWLMMTRWWTATLLSWNRGSGLAPALVTRAVLALFGIVLERDTGELAPDDLGMPDPDAAHGLTPESYTIRLENALDNGASRALLMPIMHGYRAAGDLASLLETVRPFTTAGIWIQRYGYLGDAKLDILRQEWGG